MFELEEIRGQAARIKVIGVGGAGGNVINNMIASNIRGVDFIAVNTDSQVLDASIAPCKVHIGGSVTRGLGAGSKPELGRQAALEDKIRIAEVLEGADMVFITAGMGGGTGTGASPVVADIAKRLGALTVAVVTKPFFYEGRQR
ncbi:MAG: cell division protein FtsZ, partial [Thermodesulfovibrionales bacterium]|nr:cell division protein FtsZ [Thermodesulfovibrionales bacterium]